MESSESSRSASISHCSRTASATAGMLPVVVKRLSALPRALGKSSPARLQVAPPVSATAHVASRGKMLVPSGMAISSRSSICTSERVRAALSPMIASAQSSRIKHASCS